MKEKLNYVFIIGFIILLLYTFRCKEEPIIVNNDKVVLKYIKDNRKDSLEKEITARNAENDRLLLQNNELVSSLSKLREKKKLQLPPSDYVEFFNKRYSTNENKSIDGYLGMGGVTSFSVFSELSDFDTLKDIDGLQNQLINNKNEEIENLKLDRVGLRNMLDDCESYVKVSNYIDSVRISKFKEKKYSFGVSVGTDTKLTTPLIKIDAGYKGYEAGYLKANNIDYLMVGRRWSW